MSAEEDEAAAGAAQAAAPSWLSLFGLVVGCLGSLAGVGGGLFSTPLLQFALAYPLKVAAATSLTLVCATASAATVAELFTQDSQLRLTVLLPLIGGVLLGAQLGFRVAQRIRTRPLRVVFVLFLLLSASRIFFGPPPTEPLGLDVELGGRALALAALVGLCGGFVAPLLGIGGGLLMVPGLLLVLPELGFAGARASSLAAGAVASGRSLWLHAGAGRVRWSAGLRLAAGALLGAGLGVWIVHLPGLRDVGRPVIGGILVFVAARFLRDLIKNEDED